MEPKNGNLATEMKNKTTYQPPAFVRIAKPEDLDCIDDLLDDIPPKIEPEIYQC